MALPSGTTISAADINTELGRTAGTAVDWNTIVRTLSNNNSSPNLNEARGVGPRHVTYAINQTTGNSGYVSSLYYDSIYDYINAHSIPNSPWRVVLNSLKDTNGYNYIEMRVLGTGTQYGTVYRYIIGNSSGLPLYPGGGPGGTNACLTCTYRSVMLSNGKLVIVHAMAATTNAAFGGTAVGMITATFNTNGSCAGVRYYQTNAGGTINNTGSLFLNDIADHSSYTLSANGNSFAFAAYYNGTYRHYVFKVDASTDTLSVKYCIFSDQMSTSTANGVPIGYEYTCKAILQSNGDVTLIRTPANADYSNAVMVNKLADGGGWSTYGDTRWGYVNSKFYLPWNGGGGNYITDASLGNNGWRSIYIDKLNYYYIIHWQYTTFNQTQVANQWYFTGTASSIAIQKIRSSDNANICKFGLTADGYAYGISSYDNKYGWSYDTYPYYALGRSSVMSIESDSSANTYIVYKTYYAKDGGHQSSPGATDLFTLTPPRTGQITFHLSKFDASGNHVWSKSLDIGSRQQGLMPYTLGVQSADTTTSNMPESMGILIREEINIVEVYVSAFLRNTANGTFYDINTNLRNVRSVHLNMTTGDTWTYQDSSSGPLNITSNYTSRTSHTVKSTTGSNESMTLVPVQKFQLTANNAVTDSNVFTSSSTWSTVSVSAYATGNPAQNSIPSLGSEYGSYTN